MKKVEVGVQLYCGTLIVEVSVQENASETDILNAAIADIMEDLNYAKLAVWRNI